MARTKGLTPKTEVKVYLTQDNAARLQLATFSPLLGKPKHGETSRIVNEALREYFLSRIQRKDS